MRGFYWLFEGKLAGGGRPGGGGARGRQGSAREDAPEARAALDADLAWLRDQGIRAVLTLTETPLGAEALARHQLEGLHLPVDDLTPPTPLQFEHALGFIDEQLALGRPVAVHCLVGQGRTGTVLAAYLIRGGASPEAALDRVRAVCPGAVGSPAQEHALHAFAHRRDWIV
jgi:polymorphic toxin system DSP-PTPase phosphatase-like protein